MSDSSISTNNNVKKLGILGAGLAVLGGVLYKALSSSSSSSSSRAGNWSRLPTSIVPRHYDLSLEPDMRHEAEGGSYTFSGNVRIELDVRKAGVSEIKLNALELELFSATVKQSGRKLQRCTFDTDPEEETATFTVPEALSEGPAVLEISYRGALNDKMKGFYRSTYGEKKIMAVTQFEATDARRALPCWDEPAVKATYQVEMTVPDRLQALSNTAEVERESVGDGLVRIKFDRTMKMSTYLLAFVVGEFESVEDVTPQGVVIRVFTAIGNKDQGRFALSVAVRTLEFYTKYFEIPYPGGKKLDMIAIPDFMAGAMENTGLVTYRETALLVDESSSSQNSIQWVALVVAHELAHQWFGNLVTMEWWTSLWLNEGYATFIEYLAVNEMFPEWNIWTQFVSLDLGRALKLDALRNSHPIEVTVNHPQEVDEIFDAISYSKGSCVIRMLTAYLGAEEFRRGLVQYLNQYAYGNAETADLWRSLEEATGKPVESVMSTWTLQTGFPVVFASRDGSNLVFEQRRFLATGPPKASEDRQVWGVPLRVACGDAKGTVISELFQSRRASYPLPEGGADWYKVNAGQMGAYRVSYSTELLDELIVAVRGADERLTASDRLGLQSDAFALNRAGLLSSTSLLAIIEAFASEREYSVWSDLSQNIALLKADLKHSPCYEKLKEHLAGIYARAFQSVGFDAQKGESPQQRLLRTTLINMLCSLRHEGTVAEAVSRFDAFVAASDRGADPAELARLLSPDVRGAVYGAAVSERGRAAHEAVLRIYNSTALNEEKVRCLQSLGATDDADLLRETLDFGFNEVRPQDYFYVLGPIQSNKHGADIAWQYLQDNWDAVVEKFGGTFAISRIVNGIGNSFATHDKADELEYFFEINEAPAAGRTIQQVLERIRGTADWLAREGPVFDDYFASSD